MAPEAYTTDQFTKEMDLFAYGLVISFTLSNGQHIFGQEKEERILRIKKKEPIVLTAKDLNLNSKDSLFDLIVSLVNPEPHLRPSLARVLEHPFFIQTPSIPSYSNECQTSQADSTLGIIFQIISFCLFTINDLFILGEPSLKRARAENISESEVMFITDIKETVAAEPVDDYVKRLYPLSPRTQPGTAWLSIYASLQLQQNPAAKIDPRLKHRDLKVTEEVIKKRRKQPLLVGPIAIPLKQVEESEFSEQVLYLFTIMSYYNV